MFVLSDPTEIITNHFPMIISLLFHIIVGILLTIVCFIDKKQYHSTIKFYHIPYRIVCQTFLLYRFNKQSNIVSKYNFITIHIICMIISFRMNKIYRNKTPKINLLCSIHSYSTMLRLHVHLFQNKHFRISRQSSASNGKNWRAKNSL